MAQHLFFPIANQPKLPCDLPALDVCLPDILRGFEKAQTKADMRCFLKILVNGLYALDAIHADEWEAILTAIKPQRKARKP